MFDIAEHAQKLEDFLCGTCGFDKYNPDRTPLDSLPVDGTIFVSEETEAGVENEIGPVLQDLGVTYELWRIPYGESVGSAEMSTYELGTFSGYFAVGKSMLISARELDALVDSAKSRGELVKSIDTLTGRAWRRRFGQLHDILKP